MSGFSSTRVLRACATGATFPALARLCLIVALVVLSPGGPAIGAATPETVDINRADAESLAAVLPGIGPVKAQAIVDYRRQHGSFRRLETLLDVKGIGPATLAKLRPLLTAPPAPALVALERSPGLPATPAASAPMAPLVQRSTGRPTPPSVRRTGVRQTPSAVARDQVPEAGTAGYFTVRPAADSAAATGADRDPSAGELAEELAEQRAVQSVREVIERVLDDARRR